MAEKTVSEKTTAYDYCQSILFALASLQEIEEVRLEEYKTELREVDEALTSIVDDILDGNN